MRSGVSVAEFSVEDGRKVVLRTPRWEDLDGLLGLINSLVDEKAQIVMTDRVSRDDEAGWLADLLVRLEKDEVFFLVAEVEGRVVGSSDLHVGRGSEVRAGTVGIVVRRGFRGLGIGSRMVRAVVEVARKKKLAVVVLSVFATNRRAIHVYERVGFVRCGRVPGKHFHRGRFVDEFVMALSLR